MSFKEEQSTYVKITCQGITVFVLWKGSAEQAVEDAVALLEGAGVRKITDSVN